jgi:MYXO-CTERM domain-containing protein
MNRSRSAVSCAGSAVLAAAALASAASASYIRTYEMPNYPYTGSWYSPTISETTFSAFENQSTVWTTSGAELRSDLVFDDNGFTFAGRAYSEYIPRGINLNLEFTVQAETPIQIRLPYYMTGAALHSIGRVGRTAFTLSQNGSTLLDRFQIGWHGYAGGGGYNTPTGWTTVVYGGDWTQGEDGMYLITGTLGPGTYNIDIDVLRTDGVPPSAFWFNDFAFQVAFTADPIPAPAAAPLLALAGLTARGRRRK